MKRTLAILAMLVVSAAVPVTALAGTAERQAYAGSHVSFDTESNAVVDYRVDGEQTASSVRVQSQSSAESEVGLGGSVGLDAVADMVGAAVSVDARSDANATLTADSGARIEAHDNGHGSLVVAAEERPQYVALDLDSDAEVEHESDGRVVFETGGNATATAMVAGDGNVTVTDGGNVTASLESDSRLVVRTYTEERTEADAARERLVVDGTAAASVYLLHQGGENLTTTVTYDENTTVDVEGRSEGRVNLTVSRTAHEGRVVVAHVSNETVESTGDVQVAVDGEAAARASSYAELRQAATGDAGSKYIVDGSAAASADAEAAVLVGIDHFSTRTVTVTDGDGSDAGGSDDGADDGDESNTGADGDDSDGTDTPDGDAGGEAADGDAGEGDSDGSSGDDDSDGQSSGAGPGFDVLGALTALATLVGLSVRYR